MHAQPPAMRVVESQSSVVERFYLTDTGGNSGEQLADVKVRYQGICHLQQEGFPGTLPFRDVARDLGKSKKVAGFVMEGCDDHVSPEARTVFAQPPAFLLPAAFRRGHRQLLVRLATFQIFGGVETGKVLPDDFLGSVPLDFLRTFVPAHNLPAGIEHEDGVVLDFLHHQTKTFLTLPQGLFRPLAFGHITNRCRDQNIAALIVQWTEADFHGKGAAVFTSSKQLETAAHGTRMRSAVIGIPVLLMSVAEMFRNQDFDWLIEQFLPGVAKHAFGLRVDQQHPPGAIHNDHGIRRGFQQTAEFSILVAQTFIVVGFSLPHQEGT